MGIGAIGDTNWGSWCQGEAGPLLSMRGSSMGVKSQADELPKVGWQMWPDPDPLLGAVVCSCNPTSGKQDHGGWHGTSGPVGPSFGSDFSDLLWRGPAPPFGPASFSVGLTLIVLLSLPILWQPTGRWRVPDCKEQE